jgi:hypothetical protein
MMLAGNSTRGIIPTNAPPKMTAKTIPLMAIGLMKRLDPAPSVNHDAE